MRHTPRFADPPAYGTVARLSGCSSRCLGVKSQHSDGSWVEVLDPDKMSLRFMHDVTAAFTFVGCTSEATPSPARTGKPRITGLR
jgi:hypothetical protein